MSGYERWIVLRCAWLAGLMLLIVSGCGPEADTSAPTRAPAADRSPSPVSTPWPEAGTTRTAPTAASPTPLPATPAVLQPAVEAAPTPSAALLPAGSPRRPFPQHVSYAAGAIRPDHQSQVELDQAVRRYYDAWRERYVADDCGPGRLYIRVPPTTGGGGRSISVSEGQGYGMIVTALLAGHDPQAQAQFDGLYRFFRDHPSVTSPDLMAWNQVQGCADVEPGNTGSAIDGDMDIAYGLLLADAQWGSGGEIDYRAEALRVIAAIMEHEVNPQTMTLLLGDWVTADEPRYYYATRTSDFMFGHLRAFEQATGDPRWQQVLEASYGLVRSIQSGYSPETGLLPDFITDTGDAPRPAEPHFLEGPYDGEYYYNACRDPWRIGVDFLLAGDERARAALAPWNAWIQRAAGGEPGQVRAGYALDGSSDDDRAYTDLAFVAPLGVGAMVDGANQAWLNRIWDFVAGTPIDAGDYYGNTLKLLAMIAMSGNWWQP